MWKFPENVEIYGASGDRGGLPGNNFNQAYSFKPGLLGVIV